MTTQKYRLIGFLLLVATATTVAVAQRSSRNSESTSSATTRKTGSFKRRKNERLIAFTVAREAAAMEFANAYHKELATLLRGLKKQNRRAYRRAVRQLFRDSERLARIKERSDSYRYELALRSWKLDSRIRLLAARVLLVRNPDPQLESRLKQALQKRVDLRIQRMEAERDRLLKRLRRISGTISRLNDNRSKAAKQELQKVKRSLGIRPGKFRRVKRRKIDTKPVKRTKTNAK